MIVHEKTVQGETTVLRYCPVDLLRFPKCLSEQSSSFLISYHSQIMAIPDIIFVKLTNPVVPTFNNPFKLHLYNKSFEPSVQYQERPLVNHKSAQIPGQVRSQRKPAEKAMTSRINKKPLYEFCSLYPNPEATIHSKSAVFEDATISCCFSRVSL